MSEQETNQQKQPANSRPGSKKKPFIEPEMKEFDDLEKQIRAPLIGTFTP